jgi:hypothetical protein
MREQQQSRRVGARQRATPVHGTIAIVELLRLLAAAANAGQLPFKSQEAAPTPGISGTQIARG